MKARRSVWTDDEVRELLRSFVPVADEVGRLQRGDDAECRVFQSLCEQGHYGGRTVPTATRQGIYAIAPSGAFLASVNSTRPEPVAKMLRQALERFAAMPAAERQLPAERLAAIAATTRFEDRFPVDGLVLAEYVRDLGRDVDQRDWRTMAWNEDQAWFTREEARTLVPDSIEVGAATALPAPLFDRLVRLHLVDVVRGQAPMFPADATVEGSLDSTVVGIDGDAVNLSLRGSTRAVANGRWPVRDGGEAVPHQRGVHTEVSGRATWDRAQHRFVAFELLALGERWGATQYNQRGDDAAPSRIGFAFVLAGPEHPRVAPAFWWAYRLGAEAR